MVMIRKDDIMQYKHLVDVLCHYDLVHKEFVHNRFARECGLPVVMGLADDYGKKVDSALHQEVLDRSEKLNIPPYNGFMNPLLVPSMDEQGNIQDVKVTYMDSFAKQMLMYSEQFGFLK